MRTHANLFLLILAVVLPGAVCAQSDTSSWSSGTISAPQQRGGDVKLLKRSPANNAPAGMGPTAVQARPVVPQPESATGGVKQATPTLPSSVPAPDGSTVAKTDNGQLAYEAYDQGRYLTALDLAKKAADAGAPEAHTLIGRLYQEGLGVGRDLVTAAQWYRKGAELGDTEAMFAFGTMLAEGGAITKDRNGAAQMFEAAARSGHAAANYNLALLFLKGDGKPENPARAAAHMRYAAERGIPQAQYDLATMYATSTGVAADAIAAAGWFEKAAASGLPEAELELGVILFQGRGMAVDQARGAMLFQAAAEKGSAVAQNRLARCYAHGAGVAANAGEAAKWHFIARAGGIDDAVLDGVVQKLSRADRTKAEQAAQAWIDKQSIGLN